MANPNNRKKIIRNVAVVVIICAVGGGVYISYQNNASKKNIQAMAEMNMANALRAELVAKTNVSSMISATGNVEADKIYSISLSTMQEISKVLVGVGDEVQEGQTLIEYDYLSSKEKLDKNLKDANISLKNAQLSLQTYNIPATQDEISAFQNAIVSAEKALYQAQLDLEQNADKIETAKENIERAQKDIERAQKDIEDTKIDAENAQRDIDNAQRDLDSNKQLYDIGAISQQEYEKAQTNYDDKVKSYNNVIKSQDDKNKAYEDKNKAYDDAVTELSNLESQTKTYEYNISTSQYNLEKAQRDLEKGKNPTMDKETQVRYEQQKLAVQSSQIKIEEIQSQINDLTDVSVSPIKGVIIEKNVEDGDVAKESTALLKLADLTKLKVSVNVSEFDASNISIGQNVTMISDGIRDKVYTGKVVFIDPQAKKDGEETAVKVDISIDNADAQLKPGFSIDVEIVTGDVKDALSVPITSIMTDQQKQKYVFIVTPENTLKRANITTGVYGDMYAEITSGVSEGENVLANPNSTLKEGDTVTLAPSTSAPEGGMGNEDAIPEAGGSQTTVIQ